MIKIKSISLGFVCSVLAVSTALAGLPTIDAGNIAGTVGIVTQGSTSIQQGIGIITNGADLNSIIGDSAGSLGKFLPGGLGGGDKDGLSFQDALKRINEGVSAFNKAQEDVKKKKEEYQALMDAVNPKKENPEEAYDDGEMEGAEYGADDYGYSEEDYDSSNVPAQQVAGQGDFLAEREVVEPMSAELAPSLTLKQAPLVGEMPLNPQLSDQALSLEKQELSIDGEVVDTEAVTASEDKIKIAPVGINRKAFGRAVQVDDTVAVKAEKVPVKKMQLREVAPIKADLSDVSVAKSPAISEPAKLDKGIVPVAPKLEAPAVQPRVQGKFRVSPKVSPLKADRLSNNTKSFSTRLMFAAKKSSNTKGANTDAYGNFISALPKRCGVSIDDLSDEEKLNECLTKVISENNASNQFDAALSRKQCQRMVYDTVVALMAEATLAKVEASSYKDTLDEQEKLGGDSNNTRDDSSVLAMSNEQIQKLLNKISLLTSSQILLDTVKQLCSMQDDVVDANSDSGDSDGEE
ncbi:MAG: hypothetical protein IJZ59_03890 [Alphaproteobacteria bacterium]|nr:hypothetical protein [Alphaproteobacteria bacterium]